MNLKLVLIAACASATLFARVGAAEVCGNGIDDDSDASVDEGCYPTLTTGQCESPLSCADTGMVSPTQGSLNYQLSPDVAPKVPFGPGIGLRRFYTSQYEAGLPLPSLQAVGAAVAGTTTVAPPWPAHQANDLALLIIESSGAAPTLTTSAGFSQLTSFGVGNFTTLTVYWKRASSSSESQPVVSNLGNHVLAEIMTFRNVAATGTPDYHVNVALPTTSVSIPGATTPEANALVVDILALDADATLSGWVNSDLSGLGLGQNYVATTQGNGGALAVATGTKLTAGTYGTTVGTLSSTRTQARMSVVLLPSGAAAPAWKKPLGDRWQHTYMTWLTRFGDGIVLHHRGRDVFASKAGSASGWDTYEPQAGFHAKALRQRQTSPYEFQLTTLTGETFVYNSDGRLAEVWDSLATPNKVLVAYDGNGQVSTVTDASTKRRLLFGYTGGLLTSIEFQIHGGSWTTYHTTSYTYSSGLLSTVTIGGSLAQSNIYSSSYLTQIQDADGKSIVAFAYNDTPGKVARVDTTQGMIGFDYSSSRTSCSGKTVLYFNRGNTSSCSADGDCGSGYLCGGKTGTGATGVCFRAARCLTVASSGEDVITGVAALGPPSESCTGACAAVTGYTWSGLDNTAMQDGVGNYTTRAFDSNGMVTQITYGDPDSNPTNGNGARTEWRFYGDTNYPGRVTEVRRRSDLSTSASSCNAASTTGCARTLYTYYSPLDTPSGKLETVTEIGYMGVDNGGLPRSSPLSYTTTYSYDQKGRLTQIDGPLRGSDDVTVFEYDGATGTFSEGFLSRLRRKKDATSYVDQQATVYDFWGNPTTLVDADGTLSCMTFSTARGVLTERREAMAGQSTCTSGAGDLVTTWTRDSALRLVQLERPDGSCMFFEYDSKGRLLRTKRRDDCNAASAGDKQEFVYDDEGLLTEVKTYDASSTLTAKQAFSYFDSRNLEKLINPVDVSKWTGITYDARGLVSQLDAEGGLGKTVFNRVGSPGADGRVTSVDRYKTSTTFDTWSMLYSWLGEQVSITDGDNKETQTWRNDQGRVVKVISPDMTYPIVNEYDEASRLVSVKEAFGGGSANERDHEFTFDNLGRPLTSDFATNSSAGHCLTSPDPAEIERVYDTTPGMCPISGGCTNTAGRLAYVRVRLMCSTAIATDNSLDQETFYAYDAAGRVVVEYIRDDAGRTAQQSYTWTLNGNLAQMTTPSGATIEWTHDSGGSNSDKDLVTAISRNGTGNPVVSSIEWYPYGPLAQFDQQNEYGGVALRTGITRNLAYRPTDLAVFEQSTATNVHELALTEDAKGRVTGRDFTSMVSGVEDSFYLYDDQDRVLCETTNVVSSCPSTGSTLKNSHSASPPFTDAGDWKQLKRPIPGSTGLTHVFNSAGYGSSHRITEVNQNDGTPVFGATQYGYWANGDRSFSLTPSQAVDEIDGVPDIPSNYRLASYDQRHNLSNQLGFFRDGGDWYVYENQSMFDAVGQRVVRMLDRNGTIASWYFYYDPMGRLTEVQYTPDTSSASTYSLFQLFWLGDRLVAYWQTDYPSVTTSKRYVITDEANRPVEMWSWPASGDSSPVWAVNPSAWGFDTNVLGAGIYQPILFAGQYIDAETAGYLTDGTTVHEPGLVLNGMRTYDPFTGAYLQFDPMASTSWSSYVYADSDPVGESDPTGALAPVHGGASAGSCGVPMHTHSFGLFAVQIGLRDRDANSAPDPLGFDTGKYAPGQLGGFFQHADPSPAQNCDTPNPPSNPPVAMSHYTFPGDRHDSMHGCALQTNPLQCGTCMDACADSNGIVSTCFLEQCSEAEVAILNTCKTSVCGNSGNGSCEVSCGFTKDQGQSFSVDSAGVLR